MSSSSCSLTQSSQIREGPESMQRLSQDQQEWLSLRARGLCNRTDAESHRQCGRLLPSWHFSVRLCWGQCSAVGVGLCRRRLTLVLPQIDLLYLQQLGTKRWVSRPRKLQNLESCGQVSILSDLDAFVSLVAGSVANCILVLLWQFPEV